MLEEFELLMINGMRLRRGGTGPPVLLLHGHPQTHVMWHLVMPALARRYTVVAADLPGYGRSLPARSGAKRDMAEAVLATMRELGFDRFRMVGHDRGGRCAYRLALDHPEAVERLAVLDVVPTAEMWRRANKEFGLVDWHWFFLAQPEPFPERMIAAALEDFYFRGDRSTFHPEALTDYLDAARDPSVIHWMCEDYRAGATVDHELDERDLIAGRTIRCPLLALWAGRGEVGRWFDVLATWRHWADDVSGRPLDCGHFMAEERPQELADELLRFFEPS
jgi:haloacetate dehalogenase